MFLKSWSIALCLAPSHSNFAPVSLTPQVQSTLDPECICVPTLFSVNNQLLRAQQQSSLSTLKKKAEKSYRHTIPATLTDNDNVEQEKECGKIIAVSIDSF